MRQMLAAKKTRRPAPLLGAAAAARAEALAWIVDTGLAGVDDVAFLDARLGARAVRSDLEYYVSRSKARGCSNGRAPSTVRARRCLPARVGRLMGPDETLPPDSAANDTGHRRPSSRRGSRCTPSRPPWTACARLRARRAPRWHLGPPARFPGDHGGASGRPSSPDPPGVDPELVTLTDDLDGLAATLDGARSIATGLATILAAAGGGRAPGGQQ